MPRKRNPHRNEAGYVTACWSKHPRLPGYFVIYDRHATPAPDIDADDRWVVMHALSSSMVSCTSLRLARETMAFAAAGGNDVDFGQYKHPVGCSCGAPECPDNPFLPHSNPK